MLTSERSWSSAIRSTATLVCSATFPAEPLAPLPAVAGTRGADVSRGLRRDGEHRLRGCDAAHCSNAHADWIG